MSNAELTIPVPSNESDRLQALYELDILDTAPEERFDRITRLASRIVDAPIVLISLVDEDRQWFKSRVGLDAEQTEREYAFCTHAIMESAVFVVPDATSDERFRDNPLVTGQPSIRFYAGAPLALEDGVQIGTICAIDTKPRELSPEHEEALRDLSRIVVDELKLRRHIVELREARADLERANQGLREFAYVAAHDLRAPIKTLITMTDIVATTTGERQERTLELIREAAVKAEDLVSGYRRLAALQIGDREQLPVSRLLEDAQHGLETPIDVVQDGDVVLDCDRVLMRQVFVNLLENVARHGVDHRMFVTCAGEEDGVLIRTRSRPREAHLVDDAVLAPFRQVTNADEGTGLGLSIVNRVVQLHDGTVHVRGDSTAFSVEITLPADAAVTA